LATFCSTLPAVAYSITSASPDDFSKAGASCCSTARIAPEHSTLISAAPAAPAERPTSSITMAANSRRAIFGILPSYARALIIRLAVDQDEVGSDVAIAVVTPLAAE
jgi:hypothetical protein